MFPYRRGYVKLNLFFYFLFFLECMCEDALPPGSGRLFISSSAAIKERGRGERICPPPIAKAFDNKSISPQ